MKKNIALAFFLTLLAISSVTRAQKGYEPTPGNLEAREWFQDAKFGLFVHWGVYSVLADGEWVMNNKKIPVEQYALLPTFFNPIDFDPAEWVSLVKEAGMNYITITSRHHDGFAMFDTEQNDYDVVDGSPYGKDIIGMLKEECDLQGIKLFLYYSQLDWHHPDYYPRGRTGNELGREMNGDWDAYIDFMNAQLTELLTNYGPLGGIWFDGMWDKWDAPWRLGETYGLIHDLQPAALIGSNHHKMPFPGEDFQMFEKDLPGKNTAGFNQTGISDLPLEMCQTMNGSWGFNIHDRSFKSTEELIRLLVTAAGLNANLLLNTGPMPNGEIQPHNVETLKEIGKWTKKYGETLYGTRGGPAGEQPWGVTTQKDNRIYIHILNQEQNEIIVPVGDEKVKRITAFDSGKKVNFELTPEGNVLFTIPEKNEKMDLILVAELK